MCAEKRKLNKDVIILKKNRSHTNILTYYIYICKKSLEMQEKIEDIKGSLMRISG
jgi:hypothetical protein